MERGRAGEVELATHVWPGGEPTVIGIHGLTANHTCWSPVAEALAPQHRFVAYDLRGRGGSDKPPRDYNLAAHNRDLLALMDRLGGLDVRAEVFDSLGPSLARLGVEFPSLEARAPDGLLREDDCLMTQDEAEAVAHGIPGGRLVVVPKTNHYTILLGDNAVVLDAVRAHLKG